VVTGFDTSVVVRPVPPFRLDATAAVLRRDERNPVDRWQSGRYTRVLSCRDAPCLVAVRQTGPVDDPEISIQVAGGGGTTVEEVVARVRLLLGLNVDLTPFYSLARGDALLSTLVEPLRGLKPPRFPTVFEALVNAIACQQISLAAGITVLGRLAERFGQRVWFEGEEYVAFPEPAELAGASDAELRSLGFSTPKARYVIGLARGLADGSLQLDGLESSPDEQVVQTLLALPGIGRWSAEYAMLRALGRLDVFPSDDVGAARNLSRWLTLDHKPTATEVREIVSRWKPWSGCVYLHLLGRSLVERGRLAPTAR
jgi:DNA-3-methyladenine glycosylase II